MARSDGIVTQYLQTFQKSLSKYVVITSQFCSFSKMYVLINSMVPSEENVFELKLQVLPLLTGRNLSKNSKFSKKFTISLIRRQFYENKWKVYFRLISTNVLADSNADASFGRGASTNLRICNRQPNELNQWVVLFDTLCLPIYTYFASFNKNFTS